MQPQHGDARRGAPRRRTQPAALAAAICRYFAPAHAEIREVRLAPTTVVQHVTDRAQAQTVGLCQISDLKGKLPTGQVMMERLRRAFESDAVPPLGWLPGTAGR